MKNKKIAANQTEVTLENGNILFISYETPVAAFVSGRGIIRTSKKWSATTTRHINKFIQRTNSSSTITEVPQAELDNFLG